MNKKILAVTAAALFSGYASASSTITLKWEHKLLDGRTDRPKIEFAHRLDNGFGFGLEQAWQFDRAKEELETGYAPEQYELTFKTNYRHRWGDRNEHEAGPVLDYQIKETAKTVRAGAFYGYRFTKEFSAKARARYAQNLDRMSLNSRYRDDYNKEMRYDIWLTYRWSDFTFVWDIIYYQKLSSAENSSGVEQHVFDNNKQTSFQNEWSAEYRLPNARAHAFYGKFKLKDKMLKSSHQSSDYASEWYGKRDNAIEFGYKWRF
ncbi:hypothetical protein RCJ22_07730 [Vibrio sp. FNV 38]|nr:hypothetical protein [Vibrio sp. FNV 38]